MRMPILLALISLSMIIPAFAAGLSTSQEETLKALNIGSGEQEIINAFDLTKVFRCDETSNMNGCMYANKNEDPDNSNKQRFLVISVLDTSVFGETRPKNIARAAEIFKKIQDMKKETTDIQNDTKFFTFSYKADEGRVHGIGWPNAKHDIAFIEVLSENEDMEQKTLETWKNLKEKINKGELQLQ